MRSKIEFLRCFLRNIKICGSKLKAISISSNRPTKKWIVTFQLSNSNNNNKKYMQMFSYQACLLYSGDFPEELTVAKFKIYEYVTDHDG